MSSVDESRLLTDNDVVMVDEGAVGEERSNGMFGAGGASVSSVSFFSILLKHRKI